jgi:predicted HicB family RNase H-like nuclease
MEFLKYKGCTGSIEYSSEDKLFYGKIMGVAGLISYEGVRLELLKKDFKEAVDTFLIEMNK